MGVVVLIRIKKLEPDDLAYLARFLTTKRLSGLNINGDITKLTKDYPAANFLLQEDNIIELSTLSKDVLRLSTKTTPSLKSVFETCFPGTTLNKNVCHAKGVRFVDWEKSRLSEDELQYAANDAHASVLLAHRLLNPVVHQPPAGFGSAAPSQQFSTSATTATAPHPPTLPDNATVPASSSIFSSLPQRLQAALVGTDIDTGNASGDDEEDDEETDEVAAGAALRKPVFAAAKDLVNAWAQSPSRTEPLLLPTCLSSEDRALLHQHCENLKLRHISVGEGDADRRLKVSKPPGWKPITSASNEVRNLDRQWDRIFSQLVFNPNWKQLRVKYDPRHWMGNFFLIAQNKSSPLFAYFCCATSDALYKVMEGELERLDDHLNKRFKLQLGIAGDKERVAKLKKRVSRAYRRAHCRFLIGIPEVCI